MLKLPYTAGNVALVQAFIDETKKRISKGVEVTFSTKASNELNDLALAHDIEVDDILDAINNLTAENYFRGIDPSGLGDFDLCVFCTTVGKANIEIYLKYGLEKAGLQILLFSNHVPDYPMKQPFKN